MKTRTFRHAPLAFLLGFALSLAPAAVEPAPEGSFSIVVIPDTQDYFGPGTKSELEGVTEVTNPVFEAHTRWIADNLAAQRIVFVSHVGDIVDKNLPAQWEVARACMDRLHGKVPYGISVGNHDMTSDGDSSLFQKYFPAGRFRGFDWYGGCFEADPGRPEVSGNNANSYQLFSAEGLDFVSLHLECNAPDDVLAWADGVLARHSERWAIVTSHMGLGPIARPGQAAGYYDDPKGLMEWVKIHGERGNSPRQMWAKCFSRHPNLLMLCSGDQRRSTAMYRPCRGAQGNVVHALMSDYSPLSAKQAAAFHDSTLYAKVARDIPRTDPLRIYRFLPRENAIEVITFDTTRDMLVEATPTVPDRDQHQFTIQNAMGKSGMADAVEDKTPRVAR